MGRVRRCGLYDDRNSNGGRESTLRDKLRWSANCNDVASNRKGDTCLARRLDLKFLAGGKQRAGMGLYRVFRGVRDSQNFLRFGWGMTSD